MLRQLVVITTSALQQLAAQRDSDMKVRRAAGVLADVVGRPAASGQGQAS